MKPPPLLPLPTVHCDECAEDVVYSACQAALTRPEQVDALAQVILAVHRKLVHREQ